MKMKLMGIAASLLLSACASTSIAYTGNSVTDGTLRSDVTKYVSLFFFHAPGPKCDRIDSINIKVDSMQKASDGRVARADEIWTVNGCSKSAAYNVKMAMDAEGETNFRVSAR